MDASKWLEAAQEDYSIAEHLYGAKKYVYSLYFCHHAIEKILKGIYIKRNREAPPDSQDLLFLAKNVGLVSNLQAIDSDLLADLTRHNELYGMPEERAVLSEKCTESYALEILKNTGVKIIWLGVIAESQNGFF